MDNKDTSEQSRGEQPARTEERRGFFTRAADKVGGLFNRTRATAPVNYAARTDYVACQQRAGSIREELQRQQQGIALDEIYPHSKARDAGSGNVADRLRSLNRLSALPVEHQMQALEAVYKYSAEEYDRWNTFTPDTLKKPEVVKMAEQACLTRNQRATDDFAIAIEPDPEKRAAAAKMQNEQFRFNEELQRRWDSERQLTKKSDRKRYEGMPEDSPNLRTYEQLPTNLFSPQVAQSRETMLEVLQTLAPLTGHRIQETLKVFDRTFDAGSDITPDQSKNPFLKQYKPSASTNIGSFPPFA